MAIPTNRASLIEYCLRKCGKPVITINIAPEQLDDAIDDALEFFREYDIDGQERSYYIHTVTQQDRDNMYITLPDNIISVIQLYGTKQASSSGQLFNDTYMIMANTIIGLTSGGGSGIENYFMAKQKLADVSWLLNPDSPFRYRIAQHKLFIDTDWSNFAVGTKLMVECYAWLDQDIYLAVWGNRQLRELATALIKLQWGDNLTKYNGVALPGGVTLNGEFIYQEAAQEVERLKSTWQMNYEGPLGFIMA